MKKFLYINRYAPHGSIRALESLEALLMGAAFDQTVSVVFIDDGVYQLKREQQSDALKKKDFSKTYKLLSEVYEIEQVYVESESLQRRGLTVADLMIPVKLIDSHTLSKLMTIQDIILNF